MQYQLILRFRKASLENAEQIVALEKALAEPLRGSATLDGHDIGARNIDLFILSADPASSFRRSKLALEALGLLDKVVAAYRLEGGARFTVVWPLGYGRKFTLT